MACIQLYVSPYGLMLGPTSGKSNLGDFLVHVENRNEKIVVESAGVDRWGVLGEECGEGWKEGGEGLVDIATTLGISSALASSSSPSSTEEEASSPSSYGHVGDGVPMDLSNIEEA
ncbi:hypothetical protein E1B28_012032 [Marasmius oreades]|uniref:Uncharacterized protein n=1 Tax=Marasmius oreades TaxID=181124 RepID=A0A9P7UN91_9AGAR|nr:uncharacterized protein E1B28_012032 [Marasmius oreades]KAG7087993.1 hypothetical protein E1B28_012032 [Marasmius oreades]